MKQDIVSLSIIIRVTFGCKEYDPLYFIESEENTNLIKAIPTRDGNVSAVNPNKLPEDQKVLYLGTGYQYASAWTSVYAYALAKNDTRCFVYEFNPRGFNYSDNASFNGYYTINIPQGFGRKCSVCLYPSVQWASFLRFRQYGLSFGF